MGNPVSLLSQPAKLASEHDLLICGVDVTQVATGKGKFQGVCVYNGKVYAAPAHSDKLLIYDTSSRAVSGVDVTEVATGQYKFQGICAYEGRVYAAPANSDKLLVFDTASGAMMGKDITKVATGQYKFFGICAYKGRVYAAPENSDKLLVYDTDRDAVWGVDVTELATGKGKFQGICAYEGKVYAAPANSDKLLVYDISSGVILGVDVTGVAPCREKFQGICAHEGKVYAAPANSDKLLVYNTVSGAMPCVDVDEVVAGQYKFQGICAYGGKVYAAPDLSDKLLVYERASGAVFGREVTELAKGQCKFQGVCAYEGKVYAAPFNSDYLLVALPIKYCDSLNAVDFLAWLEAHASLLLVRGNTRLHIAARVGHVLGCKTLVNDGAQVKVPNDARNVPRDVAQKYGHTDVVQYFDDLASFTEMRGGSGDAYDVAMRDERCVAQVSWYTIPLRGTIGRFGGLHSFLAITVRDSRHSLSSDIYILEKAATDKKEEAFENGVFLSHWRDAVHSIEGEPLHTLQQEAIRGDITMRHLRQMAVVSGQYDVINNNCHHTAQAIYNECAGDEYRVESMPNSIFVQCAVLLDKMGVDLMTGTSTLGSAENARSTAGPPLNVLEGLPSTLGSVNNVGPACNVMQGMTSTMGSIEKAPSTEDAV